MVFAEPSGPLGFSPRVFEILLAKGNDDWIAQGLRPGCIKAADRYRVCRVRRKYGLKAIQPCKRFGGLSPNCDEPAVKVGYLLFVHKFSAGGDNIVLRFKRIYRTL